ncbi:FAD-dependent oxidoreductase [Ideonella sp. YS5]|uniref:FAD-dependent oxidoreductase n=1 Tax=Ideonella sp. YS5 TaxID=3453714 RepID=UPI003EF020BE
MTQRVVVVGAGIAGLACALSCAQAGAEVDVLEARHSPGHVPATVDLVPSLLRDLARLGVADGCTRRGFAYCDLSVVDENGEEALRVPTPRLAGPQLPPAAGVALDDLLELLAGAATQAGATLHRGCAARVVEPRRGRVEVDGGAFAGDLVVLATGADSPLAATLFGAAPSRFAQHTWWHTLMPRPPWLERSTWMAGSVGRRLLLVPSGMSRAGMAVVGTQALEGPMDGPALMRLLQSWGPLPRRVAALMEPSSPVAPRPVASALREAPWHRGAVLCVGAAAHAIAPPFGQSAAQALEDAVVLGELVAARLERPLLLRRFMERRGARVQRLHALVERAACWMLNPEPETDLKQIGDEISALVSEPA